MYIVYKYKSNFYSPQNRKEMLSIDLLFFLFLKLMQINVIFANNVFILSIYRVLRTCIYHLVKKIY